MEFNCFLFCDTAELVSEEQQRELLDIDGSSEVMEDGIRKLNTISHYEVSVETIPMSQEAVSPQLTKALCIKVSRLIEVLKR